VRPERVKKWPNSMTYDDDDDDDYDDDITQGNETLFSNWQKKSW